MESSSSSITSSSKHSKLNQGEYVSIFLDYLKCLDLPSIEGLPKSLHSNSLPPLINDLRHWIEANINQRSQVDYYPYLKKLKVLWQVLNEVETINSDESVELIVLLLDPMAKVEKAIFWQDTENNPYMLGYIVNQDELLSVVGKFLLHIIPKLVANQQETLLRLMLEALRNSTKNNIPKPCYYSAMQKLAKLLGEESIKLCCEYCLEMLSQEHIDSPCYEILPNLLLICSEDYRYKFFSTLVEKLIAFGAFRVKQKNLQYLFVKVYNRLPSEEKHLIYRNIIVPMQKSPHRFLRQSLTEILEELEPLSEESSEILKHLAKDNDAEVQRFAEQVLDNLARKSETVHGVDNFTNNEKSFSDENIENLMANFLSEKYKAKNNLIISKENKQGQELYEFKKSINTNLKDKCISGLNHKNEQIRKYCWKLLNAQYLVNSSDRDKQAWINIIFSAFKKSNFVLSEIELIDYVSYYLSPIKIVIPTLIKNILLLFQETHHSILYHDWVILLIYRILSEADNFLILQVITTFESLIFDKNYSTNVREIFLISLNSICNSSLENTNKVFSVLVKVINQKDLELNNIACELIKNQLYEVAENQLSDVGFFKILGSIELNTAKYEWQFQETLENLFGFLVAQVAQYGNSKIGNCAISTLILLLEQTNYSSYAIFTKELFEDYGVYSLDSLVELKKAINAPGGNDTEKAYDKITCFISNNQLQQATNYIDQLETRNKFLPRLEFYRAEIKFKRKEYSSAIEDYNNFINSQPYYIQAKIRLFECYQNLHEFYAEQAISEQLILTSPQLELPTSSDYTSPSNNSLLTFEHCIEYAAKKLKAFNKESLSLVKEGYSDIDILEQTIVDKFEQLKSQWFMHFGEKFIKNYFDKLPAIEWKNLIRYPHQLIRYTQDIFLGILIKIVPVQSVKYYRIYYQIIQRMQSLDSHISESGMLSYISADNPIGFLKNKFEIYSAYEFIKNYAFTGKLNNACALGLSGDASSAYNLLTGVLQLKHWELAYHEVQVEPSGTTAHTNEFLHKVFEKSQVIVMFVPVIVKKADKDNPTLDEIKYLLDKATKESLKLKVYLVFGAYEFLPIYIQKLDPIAKKLASEASFKVILDHLISFYNVELKDKALHYRNLIIHMLKTRIYINVNAAAPEDQNFKNEIDKNLEQLFKNEKELVDLVDVWLNKLPKVQDTANGGLIKYIPTEWKNFQQILNIISALLFNDLPWVNSKYQLPNLNFIYELENRLNQISDIFDKVYRQQVIQTASIENCLKEISKFFNYLLILKKNIEYGLHWKGIGMTEANRLYQPNLPTFFKLATENKLTQEEEIDSEKRNSLQDLPLLEQANRTVTEEVNQENLNRGISNSLNKNM